MTTTPLCRRPPAPRSGERGVALGLVLVLLVLLLVGGGIAAWGLRTELSSAGNERLSRQLQDCAEQGLTWGNQFFTSSGLDWDSYLAANNVCANFPCPPFGRLGSSGTGTPPPNYPTGAPYTKTVTFGGINLRYTVGIFDNAEPDDATNPNGRFSDGDGQVIVYSRCVDPSTGASRAVQAQLTYSVPQNSDYGGQQGGGYRAQGNASH